MDKGVTVAVFEALREYISEMTRNEQCVEYGCRALKGILMHPYVTERERERMGVLTCVVVCYLFTAKSNIQLLLLILDNVFPSLSSQPFLTYTGARMMTRTT